MTIKPFSTHTEDRRKVLELCAEMDSAYDLDDYKSAANRLAKLVSAILKDEKYAEEKGVHGDGWMPIETARGDVTLVFWLDWADDCAKLNPPLLDEPWRRFIGKCGEWPSPYKATHWTPLHQPPALRSDDD